MIVDPFVGALRLFGEFVAAVWWFKGSRSTDAGADAAAATQMTEQTLTLVSRQTDAACEGQLTDPMPAEARAT